MTCAAGVIGATLGTMLVFGAGRAFAQESDPWFGRDKALHFSASAVIASGGYAAASIWTDDQGARLAVGGGVALAAGLGKELYDLSGRGDASLRDLTWDVIGTATGLLVAWSVNRFIQYFVRAPQARSPG